MPDHEPIRFRCLDNLRCAKRNCRVFERIFRNAKQPRISTRVGDRRISKQLPRFSAAPREDRLTERSASLHGIEVCKYFGDDREPR